MLLKCFPNHTLLVHLGQSQDYFPPAPDAPLQPTGSSKKSPKRTSSLPSSRQPCRSAAASSLAPPRNPKGLAPQRHTLCIRRYLMPRLGGKVRRRYLSSRRPQHLISRDQRRQSPRCDSCGGSFLPDGNVVGKVRRYQSIRNSI